MPISLKAIAPELTNWLINKSDRLLLHQEAIASSTPVVLLQVSLST
ncbi:MAG TPA: hypothetical protein V6D11_24110 [Waterburya sp.]